MHEVSEKVGNKNPLSVREMGGNVEKEMRLCTSALPRVYTFFKTSKTILFTAGFLLLIS